MTSCSHAVSFLTSQLAGLNPTGGGFGFFHGFIASSEPLPSLPDESRFFRPKLRLDFLNDAAARLKLDGLFSRIEKLDVY